MEVVLRHCFNILVRKEYTRPPPQLTSPYAERANRDHFYVMLLNDEVHTYDQVCNTFCTCCYMLYDQVCITCVHVIVFFFACFTCTPDRIELFYWCTWHRSQRWGLIIEWRNLFTGEKLHWSYLNASAKLKYCYMLWVMSDYYCRMVQINAMRY